MKFVIGTAQIKKRYGILGNHLKLSEAKKIFKTKEKILTMLIHLLPMELVKSI